MKTTQKLDDETLDRVRDHGKMGDSFNGVLIRLLDRIEDLENKIEVQQQNLEELTDDEVEDDEED